MKRTLIELAVRVYQRLFMPSRPKTAAEQEAAWAAMEAGHVAVTSSREQAECRRQYEAEWPWR
jgi:hypothetical protein